MISDEKAPTDTEKNHRFTKIMNGEIALSPSMELLGWEMLEFDADAGTATVRYDAKPEFRNVRGNVQGGFVTAMLDLVMAPALFVTLDEGMMTPTIEIKTNFLEPVRIGTVIGKARVKHKGRTIGFVDGHLEDIDGNVLATASATFRILAVKG